ncbi:MAG: class I SAM-dependent methyltransferase [Halobacteriota archaeon]
MVERNDLALVKTEFDFGWKHGDVAHPADWLLLEYQKGDILDVGCGTCRLYKFLTQKEWMGRYVGIDTRRYPDYEYPAGIELIIGDAYKVSFPEVDTVVLYQLLEHVDEPHVLLSKALEACRENVLLLVPKRNEALWERGVVEYHQLDKTHRHCGFSKEEMYNIVRLSGGEMKNYKDVCEIKPTIGIHLWNNITPKAISYLMSKIFSFKTFYGEIWCEVVKR